MFRKQRQKTPKTAARPLRDHELDEMVGGTLTPEELEHVTGGTDAGTDLALFTCDASPAILCNASVTKILCSASPLFQCNDVPPTYKKT